MPDPTDTPELRATREHADRIAADPNATTGELNEMRRLDAERTRRGEVERERDAHAFEARWLMEEVEAHTGATEAEIRSCMNAPVHKRVIGHKMGSELRKRFSVEYERDAALARVAELEADCERLRKHGSYGERAV